MGIAKMKKLTLLAEQTEKEAILRAMQGLQNIDIISLAEAYGESELIQGLHFEEQKTSVGHLTQTIQDIRYAISFLNQYIPAVPFFKKMKEKRSVYTLEEFEQELKDLDHEALLQRVSYMEQSLQTLNERMKALGKEEYFFRQWQNLKFLPQDITDLKHFNVRVGTIETEKVEQFEAAIAELEQVYEEDIYQTDDTYGYLIILPKEFEADFQPVAQQFGFQELAYPYEKLPQAELEINLAKQKDIREKMKQEKKSLSGFTAIRNELQLAEEYFYNVREREKAKELILNSPHVFVISGWAPADQINQYITQITEQLGEEAVASLTTEVAEEESNQVPTLLKNSKLVEPFESITAQYGLPKYTDIDPTPFYYPFHIAFFGMMSADFGYGLILWLVTLFVIKKVELSRGMQTAMKMFHQLSYGTMAFGLIFGSFLGFDLPFRLLNLTTDLMVIMGLSVFLGILHMLLGYILNIYSALKAKDYVAFYLDGAQWTMMLLGIVALAMNMLFFNVAWLQTLGLILLLGNIIGMVLVKIFSNENKLVGAGQAAFGIMDISGLVGDLVSYTRLSALAVSGANIGMAFNLILGLLPPFARFTIGILLFIALHALNIFIAFLGAYVHSMRLQYVEFFGKFYEGGGKAFSPLKTLEKYIWIK